ncbi:MAG: cysteine synthase A [Epsilonproteobacteria bacterium]|nr:cysteine synthase A [Campylobacterota bacterium]MBD3839538.1 cysteine synthase A [Campylobacterota bacterium]
MIASGIDDLIGDTPLIKLQKLSLESGVNILAKCEFLNPTSSIKDRTALWMINGAIKRGEIDKNSTLIEPTSGNTGVALASICASKGIKLILTMPESMSIERRKLFTFLGASIVLTPASEGMSGAIKKAKELVDNLNGFMLSQFDNEDNALAHLESTAIEILMATHSKIDAFVSAVGTGGTISGTGKGLKQTIPHIKIVAVEPTESSVLSGNKPSPHGIQGIGAGFIPKILNQNIYDEIITVNTNEAINMASRVAKEEGLLIGISAGANLVASMELAKRMNKGETIVTILCDTAQRYLSTALFDE